MCGDTVQLNQCVVMNSNTIEWTDSVRHLGNPIDANLPDSFDCRYKCSMFMGYVNNLFGNFGQPMVLPYLFKKFLWSFSMGLHSNGFNYCMTAWNIGVRNNFDLPHTHAHLDVGTFDDFLHMNYKLYLTN